MPLPNAWTREEILGLSLLPRIKAVTVRQCVEQRASLGELLQTPLPELDKVGIVRGSLFPSRVQENIQVATQKQHELCEQNSVRIVTFWDDDYPSYLREIYYPPTVLYVRGVLQASDAAAISIVGTRNCTDYGKLTAERYADYFAHINVIVVSGLANGVDMIAHRAVVAATGITYAVIASGIDKISSSYANTVAAQISERGAVISEYSCGTGALPGHFPQRNRIISGIAQGTVVIESGEKGGSLITAKFALDQNRELFAVPGRIISDKSRGTNLLIKRGHAHLTLEPQDVIETLGWVRQQSSHTKQLALAVELNASERRVYELLSAEPIHIDDISGQLAVPIHELLVTLLELEFKGIIRQLPGKQFIKAE